MRKQLRLGPAGDNRASMMEALADNLVAFQRRENTSLPLLKRQLTETAQGIDNLLNAIQQGILTPSTKTRLEELEETKAQLEISILQAEMEKPPISREQFLFWLYRFRGIDISQPDQRQRLIDSFVNAIYLYDDKIVLTFNYQDGTKTITLEQVSGSDLGAGTAPLGMTGFLGFEEPGFFFAFGQFSPEFSPPIW